MSQNTKSVSPASSRRRQRWALGALIAATSASVVLSISAWAGGDGASAPHMLRMGMEAGGPPLGGAFGGAFGGRRLQRLLDDAQASDAQKAQIRQIADKTQADLKALFEEGKGLHEQGLQIWAAPKLDAAAAENLRQQMQAQHDKVSKRMLQAMLDVGNVLTPEQRATVAKQIEKHHEDMAHRIQFWRDRHPGEGQPGKSGEPSERQAMEQ